MQHIKKHIFTIKPKSYFLKTTIFLFVIMILFTLLIIEYSYYISSGIIRQKINQDIMNTNSQIESNINSAFENAEFLMLTLSEDPFFSTDFENLSVSDILYLSKDYFKKNLLANFIDSVYIYYNKSEKVITSNNGIVDISLMSNREWLEEYKKIFPAGFKMHTFMPKHYVGDELLVDCITIISGFPVIDKAEKGAIVLNINKERFFGNASISLSSSQKLLVTNKSGQLLYGDAELYEQLKKKNVYTASPDADILQHDNMIIAKKTSKINKWTYLVVDDTQVYTKELRNLQKTLLFVLAFSVLVILFFTIVSGKIIYKPVHKLVNRLKTEPEAHSSREINEFDIINQSIENLIVIKKNSEEFRLKSQHSILQGILINLCYHNIDRDDTKYLLKQILPEGLDIENHTFFAIVIHIEQYDRSSENPANLKSINNFIPSDTNILFTHLSEEMLVGLVTISATQNMYELMNLVHTILKNRFGIYSSIGIGNTYASLNKFSLSFNEALDALRYKSANEKTSITHIKQFEVAPSYKKYYYSLSKGDELSTAIKCLNEEEAIRTLSEIYLNISSEMSDADTVSELFWLTMSDVLRTINSMGLKYESFEGKTFFEDYSFYNNLDTIEKKYDFIKNKVIVIINKTTVERNHYHASIAEKIKKYINEHYQQELSLNVFAEMTNLNTIYISEIFKESSGMGVREYIKQIRFEKAKELLINTNQNIETISQTVGYENTRSFLRAFKNYAGVTPTEYRNRNEKKHI